LDSQKVLAHSSVDVDVGADQDVWRGFRELIKPSAKHALFAS
jgi:hypothetical protein